MQDLTPDKTPNNLDIVEASPEIQDELVYTNSETGLTEQEVATRVAEGKINGEQTIKTKSVPQILRENILTFFNFVFVAFAVILVFFVFLDKLNIRFLI